MSVRHQSNKWTNGHNKLTTIYLHSFQTVLDENECLLACLMTIYINKNQFRRCSNKFYCISTIHMCVCGSPIFPFGSLSWWLKIWMIFMFAQNILLSTTHFVAFSATNDCIDQTERLWYGMEWSQFTVRNVKYSFATNWIRALLKWEVLWENLEMDKNPGMFFSIFPEIESRKNIKIH